MTGTGFRKWFAFCLASTSLLFSSLVRGQTSATEQCSLALVADVLVTNGRICDGKVVQTMATSGKVFEENQLGIESMLVIGPGYNQKSALKWFEKAARHGYAPSQVNLAVMYLNGWGTPIDFPAALHWLQAAAAQGFARAYFNLGILSLEGKGVPRDYAEARRWFQKGADANDSFAQSNLGYMYDEGLGVARDVQTAASWYRKAADHGNPLGESNLADLYLRGEGVQQDYVEAFRLFQKAAAQRETTACLKLGYMYAQGLGTAKDPQAAYMWIVAANLAGDRRGKELMASLETVLTAQQISAARERAQHPQSQASQQLAKSFVP
jgi:TPR repeat protein